MNRKNVQRLIDHLQSIEDQRFDMGTFVRLDDWELDPEELTENDVCGTAACLMGHAAVLSLEDTDFSLPPDNTTWCALAGSFLDIPQRLEEYVYLGRWSPYGTSADRDDAIRYLQKALAEGTFDVSIPREEPVE